MARHLSKLRTKAKYLNAKKRYRNLMARIPGGLAVYNWSSQVKKRIRKLLIPATIFENMGMRYIGPVDGHNLSDLIASLQSAVAMDRPVLVHVLTQKGRGYRPAEREPSRFHGIGAFDPDTGSSLSSGLPTFSATFGNCLCEISAENDRVCAITAAMPAGTGLLSYKQCYPKRFFDVGIAEEHAVSMAGGLAKQGMIPVVALYSTFLQRCYDQILQDITMLKLHVVLAVDRAGLVGEDGETHHGVFDVGFLRHAPGMRILCPASCMELSDMLRWAISECTGPVAIRYPRGGDGNYSSSMWLRTDETVCCHRNGKDAAILTYGTLVNEALKAADILEASGFSVGVLRLLDVSSPNVAQIAAYLGDCRYLYIVEESLHNSGVREVIACQLVEKKPMCCVRGVDLGSEFITHGSIRELYKHCGLDADSVAKQILEEIKHEGEKTAGCAVD